jgi:hypothetical protein
LRAEVQYAINNQSTHEMYVICGAFILEPPLIIRNPELGREKIALSGPEPITAVRTIDLPT